MGEEFCWEELSPSLFICVSSAHKFGTDAFLLSDFAAPRRKDLCCDLGTGCGIIPLLWFRDDPPRLCYGADIQKQAIEQLEQSIQKNGLKDRFIPLLTDLKELSSLPCGPLDLVTCNPPYTQGQGGLTNRNSAKAIARHETTAGLADFVQCASRLLKPKGSFFMVHRPSRLVDLCAAGRAFGLEPKELCFVSPKEGEIPNIMLVHMIKGGGPELRLLRPLYIYDEAGNYTEELRACYR